MKWGSWRDGDLVESFRKETSTTIVQLLAWSKKEFNGKKEKLKRLKKKLADMKSNFQHYEEVNEIKSTEDQIERLLLDEEVYWKQRSQVDWLKVGDKNTKFFHFKASSRKKKKNQIEGILNHEDVWIEDREEIKREFHVYFVNMFMTSCPTNMQIEIALAGLKPRVTAEMNEQLDMPFTEEVVLTALS